MRNCISITPHCEIISAKASLNIRVFKIILAVILKLKENFSRKVRHLKHVEYTIHRNKTNLFNIKTDMF